MNGPRTLVTGGPGYVGRFIVEGLLAAGHEVMVTGRRSPAPGFFSRPVGFAAAELHPDIDYGPVFAGVDNLVHCAFDHIPGRYRGGEGADPDGFRLRNQHGTNALMKAARQAGVGRAVFLSSRAVYGTQPPGLDLTEDTQPHPDTLYGEVKLAVERRMASMEMAGFGTAILRVTGVFGEAGPGRSCKWTELIHRYLEGMEVGSRVGSEVHGADVAAAVLLALTCPTPALCNVSDLLVDNADLLALAQKMTGSANPLPPPADGSRLNVMDCSRLHDLGWQPGGQARVKDTVERILMRLGRLA
jgi:nucleoside-diphosphate-sugar epimerase